MLRIAAPTAHFSNVDKLDGRCGAFCLRGQFSEKFLFLGASHNDLLAGLNGFLKGAGFSAAKCAVQRERFTQRLTQFLGLQGHGLIAIA